MKIISVNDYNKYCIPVHAKNNNIGRQISARNNIVKCDTFNCHQINFSGFYNPKLRKFNYKELAKFVYSRCDHQMQVRLKEGVFRFYIAPYSHNGTRGIGFRHPEPNILTGPFDAWWRNFSRIEHYIGEDGKEHHRSILSRKGHKYLNRLKSFGCDAVVALHHNFFDPVESYYPQQEIKHAFDRYGKGAAEKTRLKLEESATLAREWIDAGLDVFSFDLNPLDNIVDRQDRICVNDEFLKKLRKFFKILRTKNVCMGCSLDGYRTNIGISLNYTLNNPKQEISSELAHTDFDFRLDLTKPLYEALTPKQKNALNIHRAVFIKNSFEHKFENKIWLGHLNSNTGAPCEDFRIIGKGHSHYATPNCLRYPYPVYLTPGFSYFKIDLPEPTIQ